ncbi:hypothetical protein LTR53_003436 [Teratosphaeriaceae sp. CCFEE 6253]|nr:hypothetical protein LTR53_003436 [Teratosphaeriaceae sp. CCFEE 6253]
MGRTFDVTGFFDQDAYSDITVAFGSRERKCHKMILCHKSRYFADLCGPGSAFAEAQQTRIELREDDGEAVDAMLRWLYTFDYEPTDRAADREAAEIVEFHLSVCLAADKYQILDLTAEALSRVRALLDGVEGAVLTHALIKVNDDKVPHPQSVIAVVNEVRDRRLVELVSCAAFRALLAGDGPLCLEMLDELGRQASREILRQGGGGKAVSQPASDGAVDGDAGLEEMSYFECKACRRKELLAATVTAGTFQCSNVRCHRVGIARPEHRAVWVKKP